MRSRRVLYVSPVSALGGAEVSLVGLLGHLDAARITASLAVPASGELAVKAKGCGVPCAVVPLHPGSRRNPLPFVVSVWHLWRAARRDKADLVHANHEFANRCAVVAARLARIPCICHVRNLHNRTSVRHHWLCLTPFLIANSHATARTVRPFLRPSQKLFVAHNGVDLRRFSGRRSYEARKRIGVPENAYLIVYAGRIAREKGLHRLVEAMAQLAPTPEGMFAVVAGDARVYGDSRYLDELRALVQRLRLGEKVKFIGHVNDVENLFACADLVVQPSDAEAFGRTLIEAMAMRTPVIGTKAGGAAEVVEDGVTGVLVAPGDSQALARAISRLATNRTLAERMGVAGRERVERLFTIEKHAAAIQEIYDRILLNAGCSRRTHAECRIP